MVSLLTADIIDIDRLTQNTPRQYVVAGDEDYRAGRAQIEVVNQSNASITVASANRKQSHLVHIGMVGQQITTMCDCHEVYQWHLCRHRIAALQALRDYLEEHPPKLWKAVVEHHIHHQRRAVASKHGPIVFSLQQHSKYWVVAPYLLAARLFNNQQLNDREALADVIDELHLSDHAKPIRSRISAQAYPHATEAEVAAANLALGSPYVFGNVPSGGEGAFYEPVFGMIRGSVVYQGDEYDPLKKRVTVSSKVGRLETELRRTADGLQLSTHVVVGGKTIAVKPREIKVIVHSPLWVLVDGTLTQIDNDKDLAETLLAYPEIHIPHEDQEQFFDQHLLAFAERVPVRGDVLQFTDVAVAPEPRLYLSELEQGLQAELRFGYDAYEVVYDKRLPSTSTERQFGSTTLARITRQPEREQELWQNLSSYGLKRGAEPQQFVLKKTVHPVDFLIQQVPRKAEAGYTMFGEEALTTARVNRNTPRISFHVNSGIDWFDVRATVSYGTLQVSLQTIRQAIKRREKYVKLADGTIGELPAAWLDRYQKLLGLGEERDEALRMGQQQVMLLDQLMADADTVVLDDMFKERRDKLRNFERIESQPLPAGFRGELRPYQKFGYDWLHFLREYGFGGCLADDMGLGKTITTLAFLQSLREREPDAPATLIVMPRTLLFNWQREAERFAPELRVYVQADAGRVADPADFSRYDLVLTTYGTMLRDIDLLRQYTFGYAILDESQVIKNPLAETSRAARRLQAQHRLVLTGTPVENSTMELWAQFAFLNPGMFGSVEHFRNLYANPIERQNDAQSAEFLRKAVYPFILRRTKAQVARDLPPRTERVLVSDMEPAQRREYEQQRDYYRATLLGLIDKGSDDMSNARMKVLEGLLRLRQISNHPRLVNDSFKGPSGKFEALFETLETLRAEGHRALVFSQFVQMLALVREELDKRDIAYCYLDGQTRDRQGAVDRFQNDERVPFFLISLKAGGVGLNLTAADYVIHIDPWWNPAVEAQATDRTHRIGQDKPVFVYKFIARNTVEEKVLQLQDQKRLLAEQIIGAEGGVFKSLTREDVEALFS